MPCSPRPDWRRGHLGRPATLRVRPPPRRLAWCQRARPLLALALELPALLGILAAPGDAVSLQIHPWPALVESLSLAAGSGALLAPPGVLLQRLSGASPWPLVAVAAASGLASALALPLVAPHAARLIMLTALQLVADGWVLLAVVLVPAAGGAMSGLAMGAGLYLMARRQQPAVHR